MPRSNRLKRQPIWGSAQLTAALSALALLLVLAGCVAVAPGAAPATQSDASPVVADAPPARVKVAVFPYLSYAPYYIAQAEGFFGDEGLEVEFVALAQASESLTALLRGDIDADTAFTLGMVNAIAAGEEVRVVANKGVLVAPECPTDALLVRTELADTIGRMDADQLRALTYSVNLTWFDAYFLDLVLQESGVSVDDITINRVADPVARIEALRQGALDVAFMSEPWITQAVESGAGVVWQPAAAVAPNFPIGVMTYGARLLGPDRAVGEALLRAYAQGIAQLQEGKTARNVEILAAATQMDPALLEKICWPNFAAGGVVDTAAITQYLEWAHGRAQADAVLTPEQFWDPAFVEAAQAAPAN